MPNLHLAHHLTLGSSMVRASHLSSEDCGFDPHLGLRNQFPSIELDDLSSLLMLLHVFDCVGVASVWLAGVVADWLVLEGVDWLVLFGIPIGGF